MNVEAITWDKRGSGYYVVSALSSASVQLVKACLLDIIDHTFQQVARGKLDDASVPLDATQQILRESLEPLFRIRVMKSFVTPSCIAEPVDILASAVSGASRKEAGYASSSPSAPLGASAPLDRLISCGGSDLTNFAADLLLD